MRDPNFAPKVGILCAITPELSAVLCSFDQEPYPDYNSEDGTNYYGGTISGWPAVATCLRANETDLANASRHASALLNRFPSLKQQENQCFMVGVAGGIAAERFDVRLGDVVVATRLLNYGKERHSPQGLQRTGAERDAPTILRACIHDFRIQHTQKGSKLKQDIDRIITNYHQRSETGGEAWPYPKRSELKDIRFQADYTHQPQHANDCSKCDLSMVESERKRSLDVISIHEGLIASADRLVRDGPTRKALQKELPDALAVDMESSALDADKFIIVRGISDYADSHKNDVWQQYAAVAAAACCIQLIQVLLPAINSKLQSSAAQPVSPQPPGQMSRLSSRTPTLPIIRRQRTSSPSNIERSSGTAIFDSFETSSNDLYSWSLSFCFASIDIEVSDTKDHNAHYENGVFNLREEKGSTFHQAHRELAINSRKDAEDGVSSSDRILWLPLENIRVKHSERCVYLRFSNCNVRRKHSVGYQDRDQPTYDASRPNVNVRILLKESECTSAATQILDHLLYRCSHIPHHTTLDILSGSNWKLYSPTVESADDANKLVILHSRSYQDQSEEISFTHINDQLDMVFDIEDDGMSVMFYGTSCIKYVSLDAITASWPPIAVQNNDSGKPHTSDFVNDISSHAILIPNDLSILRKVFAPITEGWDLCSGPYTADIRKSQPRSLLKKAVPKASQITIWRKDTALHILMRDISSDEMMDDKWSCVKLEKPKALEDAPKFSSSSSNREVYLHDIAFTEGVYLSRTEMLPDQGDASQEVQPPVRLSLIADFETTEDKERFLESLEECIAVEAGS